MNPLSSHTKEFLQKLPLPIARAPLPALAEIQACWQAYQKLEHENSRITQEDPGYLQHTKELIAAGTLASACSCMGCTTIVAGFALSSSLLANIGSVFAGICGGCYAYASHQEEEQRIQTRDPYPYTFSACYIPCGTIERLWYAMPERESRLQSALQEATLQLEQQAKKTAEILILPTTDVNIQTKQAAHAFLTARI